MDGYSYRRSKARSGPLFTCSALTIILGVLLVLVGLSLMVLDNLEYGPTAFDSLYSRYDEPSLQRTLGPLFVGFGSFVIAMGLLLACYSAFAGGCGMPSHHDDHDDGRRSPYAPA